MSLMVFLYVVFGLAPFFFVFSVAPCLPPLPVFLLRSVTYIPLTLSALRFFIFCLLSLFPFGVCSRRMAGSPPGAPDLVHFLWLPWLRPTFTYLQSFCGLLFSRDSRVSSRFCFAARVSPSSVPSYFSLFMVSLVFWFCGCFCCEGGGASHCSLFLRPPRGHLAWRW